MEYADLIALELAKFFNELSIWFNQALQPHKRVMRGTTVKLSNIQGASLEYRRLPC